MEELEDDDEDAEINFDTDVSILDEELIVGIVSPFYLFIDDNKLLNCCLNTVEE